MGRRVASPVRDGHTCGARVASGLGCIWSPRSRPSHGLGHAVPMHAVPIPSGPRRRRHHPRLLGAGHQPCRRGGGHRGMGLARWHRRGGFDRAAALLCWAGRATHPAAEVEAEAELEIVRRSGEIGRRSGLGRHRRGEGETAVRAVPGGHIGLRPGCTGLQGCRAA